MRRALQWAFNVLAALSLVLCVAAVLLWARSYATNETVGWYSVRWESREIRTAAYGLSSDTGGLLIFALHRDGSFAADDPGLAEFQWRNPHRSGPSYLHEEPAGYPWMSPEYTGWGILGFGFFNGERTPPVRRLISDDRFAVVPYWFVVLAAAIGPARWLVMRMRRRRRLARGSCTSCGYDLRASPGRCPECGTVVTAR